MPEFIVGLKQLTFTGKELVFGRSLVSDSWPDALTRYIFDDRWWFFDTKTTLVTKRGGCLHFDASQRDRVQILINNELLIYQINS